MIIKQELFGTKHRKLRQNTRRCGDLAIRNMGNSPSQREIQKLLNGDALNENVFWQQNSDSFTVE
jgi:hypothetical protein